MKNEHLAASIVIGAILFLFNIVYIKYHEMNMEMNGERFSVVGMMQYTNPSDGNVVYLPLYSRMKK